MAKVILDAGHGGNDLGGVYGDRYEKNDNLELTLAVGEILRNNGVEVINTRLTDAYQSPLKRVELANQEGGDLFVSIHRSTSPVPNTLNGVLTQIYNINGIKTMAAEKINANLEGIGFLNNGIEIRIGTTVLRDTDIPSIMLFVGFINSDYDNQLFDAEFNNIAEAIATGIIDTLLVSQQNNFNSVNSPECNNNEQIEPPTNNSVYRYRVQVGLFRIYDNAMNITNQLLHEGYQAEIVRQGEYMAVHVGDFTDLDDAAELERLLRMGGYNTLLVAV